MHITLIPPQDAAQPRPWIPGNDSGCDYTAAHREGWTVSEAAPAEPGKAGIPLQRPDGPETCDPKFAGDRDDWTHVVRHAREGSPLHRHALALIDDVERCLIEGLHGFW